MANRRLLPVLCLLVLLGLGGAAARHRVATAGASAPTSPQPDARDFGAWRYMVNAEGTDSATVTVAYDKQSVGGLRAFAVANAALARQLQASGVTRADVVVTFKRPLSLDEFANLAADHGLKVGNYTLRMTAANGQRWTVGGAPVDRELIPRSFLDREIAFVRSKAPEATLDGVVDATISLDMAQYAKLHAVPDVFLIDVTAAVVLQELRQRNSRLEERKLTVDASRPYWFMENQGLANFR